MSAHKRATISLSAADYRRLEEASERLRQVEENYQGLKKQLQSQRSDGLWSSYQEIAQRQAGFQEALAGMDDALQQTEAQAGQALLDEISLLHQQIGEWGDNLWQDTSQLLAEQAARLDELETASQAAQLEQLRLAHRQNRRQAALLQQVQQSNTQHASRSRMAAQALQAAGVLLEALTQAELTPAEQVEMHEQALSLQMAQDNLAGGMYEACLSGAQQAYVHLSGLRRKHEAACARRSALLQAALERTHLLQDKARRQAQAPAIGLDGDVLETTIDTDWWSAGRLSVLDKRISELFRTLNQNQFQEPDLLELHQSTLPAFERELEDILYHARREVLASQLRYNIAVCVVDALKEQGFSVQNGGYEERDMRGGYCAVVQHLDGSEVLLQVRGENGEAGSSQLDLYSLDRGMRTAHEMRQRVKEMAASLRAHGLEVGKREERPDSGAPRLLRQEQPSYAPASRD